MLASSSVGRALRCYRSPRRFESCLASHFCITCTHSSAGRAPLLQSRGPWFDSKCVYQSCDVSSAALAQRIRVPGFDPGGRRFKSCTPLQFSSAGSHRGLVARGVSSIGRAPGGEPGRCGFESRASLQRRDSSTDGSSCLVSSRLSVRFRLSAPTLSSGLGSAGSERLPWEQEVVGSNPTVPTRFLAQPLSSNFGRALDR